MGGRSMGTRQRYGWWRVIVWLLGQFFSQDGKRRGPAGGSGLRRDLIRCFQWNWGVVGKVFVGRGFREKLHRDLFGTDLF